MKQQIGKNPYDRIAPQYDSLFGEHNPYYKAVNQCERELFEDWISEPASHQLALDVGCGTGFHTKWLTDRGFNAIGIDKSTEMIQIAKANSVGWNGDNEFKVMNVDDLAQMSEGIYSVVLCLGSVLNHLEDWKGFAKLVASRLRNGGLFFFSYDNIDGVDVIARILLRQFAGYSEAYIRDILFGRLRARFTGKCFNNHWRVCTDGAEVEVPLKYEHTHKWRWFLEEAGLKLCELRGTHLLDCFDQSLLQASAGIDVSVRETRCSWPRKWLRNTDRVLARRLHHIAANVVGIAVKK
jgi:2-polyprenyl-3-methyl-5-hydroxy-6-metoxy-1,4-benzoquinol methylase